MAHRRRLSVKPGITLGNYQEIRIRHFERAIDRYVAMPPVTPGNEKTSIHGQVFQPTAVEDATEAVGATSRLRSSGGTICARASE